MVSQVPEAITTRDPTQRDTGGAYGWATNDSPDLRWVSARAVAELLSPSEPCTTIVDGYVTLELSDWLSPDTSTPESEGSQKDTCSAPSRTLVTVGGLNRWWKAEPTLNCTFHFQGRFDALTQEWKRDTRASSSITEIAMHPAYQQIIGMGKQALPFIFRELQEEPDHWFWALKAITGEDPVPPAARGRLSAMRQAWLEWAGRNGYQAWVSSWPL